MRLNKNIKIFINYFLGPLLFAWLLYSIWHQVQSQPHLETSWLHVRQAFYSSHIYYLYAVIVLMLVNWSLEAAKWKLSVRMVHPVSFWQSFKAVLSGVAFSVSMPNRVGDYLGRILYLPDGKRLKVISITVINSISQVLVTVVAGTAGFIVLKNRILSSALLHPIAYRFVLFGLISFSGLLALFYFNIGALEKNLERWLKKSPYLYLVQSLQSFGMQRLQFLMLLSLARYVVFILQYNLCFCLFGVDVTLLNGAWVMTLVFLALAVIPSIVLLEVGIRGQVSLMLVGLFTVNKLGILLSSVTIWAINLILPALAGSLLILGINVFKKRNEKA